MSHAYEMSSAATVLLILSIDHRRNNTPVNIKHSVALVTREELCIIDKL